MLPIPENELNLFKMIVSYIKAGGTPTPKMEQFINKYQIKREEFIEEAKRSDETLMEFRLRKAGLINEK